MPTLQVKAPSGEEEAAATPAGGAVAPAARAQQPRTIGSAYAVPAPRTYSLRPLVAVEHRVMARLRSFVRAEQQRRRLSVVKRINTSVAVVRDSTEGVLLSAGLGDATFVVADGGRTVTVTIPRQSACGLHVSDADGIGSRILDSGGLVKQVSVLVEGSSLPLDTYLSQRCTRPPASKVPGKIVFQTSGTGIMQTPQIHVSGPTWKISYVSSSALLQVYVYRGGKLDSVAVNRRGRGTGTRTLKGSGSFRLQVAATGQWSLRVYGAS